mmetsp:Transcript_34517/g.78721  ORF Transcript_34517/g.78721 Transcript_34517/m.78721 type:complete len:357 (+) Transcript_34517:12-1082(+)
MMGAGCSSSTQEAASPATEVLKPPPEPAVGGQSPAPAGSTNISTIYEIVAVAYGRKGQEKDCLDVTEDHEIGRNFVIMDAKPFGPCLHIANARRLEVALKALAVKTEFSGTLAITFRVSSTGVQHRAWIENPSEMTIPFRPQLYLELIDRGFSPDWDKASILEAWFAAARSGNTPALETIHRIFGSTVAIDEKDAEFCTALMLTCLYGHLEATQFLLSAGAELNTVTNNASDNAFMFSMMRAAPQNVDLTGWLMTQGGADAHVHNYERGTLLHHAVFWGNLHVVKLLVMEGVDPNAKDVHGQDAVEALDMSVARVGEWLQPYQTWSKENAVAAGHWLRTEGPKYAAEKRAVHKSSD